MKNHSAEVGRSISGPRNSACSRGFTLVELLVVIAIIGILIGMLLPAVQQVRESARRVHCSNNFKQAGLAIHNYQSSMGIYPIGDSHVSALANTRFAWGGQILPYVEQGNLADLINFELNPHAQPTILKTIIPMYLCASDPHATQLVGFTSVIPGNEDAARTCMDAIIDSVNYKASGIVPKTLANGANGAFANLDSLAPDDIQDGLSNTIFISEVTGDKEYYGHMWCFLNSNDTAGGINGLGTVPGGYAYSYHNNGPSSYHPGGCHFLLGDGSIHFVTESISPTTMAAMTTRKGREVDSFINN